LVDLVSRDYLPIKQEEQIYARSRSPVRVSFGGGGSDLTHYFANESGAVINTTISLYSHATLRKRKDRKIAIYSQDLNDELRVDNFQELLNFKGKFGLFQALLRTIHPDFGFDLFVNSDFPMRSGLGGSAVVSAAVLGCFNQFRQDKWDQHELAELAFQAERLYLGVSGGWQDQYATVFGGFNFMEFNMERNVVHPLRVQHEIQLELEESLVLCDTSIAHDSGEIHNDQRQNMEKQSVRHNIQSNVELTYRMRNYLLRGQLIEFGRCLHQAWIYKRQFSDKISNDSLDSAYALALSNGAIGGKLLGAGGGGFFLFYTPPFAKHQLIGALEENGYRVRPFRFEPNGLQAWSVREGRNHMGDDTHDV
jgi:D-glycero-alpha-D-manno-heptose-7-phosphate kinase